MSNGMITDERLKQLMTQVGMPESLSLMQALRQCDMEARIAEREKLSDEALERAYDAVVLSCLRRDVKSSEVKQRTVRNALLKSAPSSKMVNDE